MEFLRWWRAERRSRYESTCDTGCSFKTVYVHGSGPTDEIRCGGPRSMPDGHPG